MSGRKQGGAPKAPPQTDLAAQLQQLAVAQGVDQGRRHLGKASLLYSFQEAADIDAETIQRIGVEGEAPMGRRRRRPGTHSLPPPPPGLSCDDRTAFPPRSAGLDQLCALDARFQAYRRTLFGRAAASGDRDANTAELNQRLDAAITGFCTVLSSYFLLAPAFKALEWLVRKFRCAAENAATHWPAGPGVAARHPAAAALLRARLPCMPLHLRTPPLHGAAPLLPQWRLLHAPRRCAGAGD